MKPIGFLNTRYSLRDTWIIGILSSTKLLQRRKFGSFSVGESLLKTKCSSFFN